MKKKLSFLVAFSVFLLWMLLTFLLEGFRLTLQRPDAILDRLLYTFVANIIVGTVLVVFVLRYLKKSFVFDKENFGFRTMKNTLITSLLGGIAGFAFFILQNPPSLNPVVIINAYCQVFVVSLAEILVCWVLLGSIMEKELKSTNKYLAMTGAILVSSGAFGIYHFAHSPPFNTVQMVVFLTLIGFITSIFYFTVKNVYATVIFHNFLGIQGVISALNASGNLATYMAPQIPLFITALVALVVLIATDLYWMRK